MNGQHTPCHTIRSGVHNIANARLNLSVIVAAYRARQKMIFQPSQARGYSLVPLLALEEVIIVPSGGFPPQISDLSGQPSEPVYEISQRQNDDGNYGNETGDDRWVSHFRLRLRAYSRSLASLIPVRVFLPDRFLANSAPMNLRCFADFAGIKLPIPRTPSPCRSPLPGASR